MIPGAPEPIGSWNTRIPPRIAVRFAATEVIAITSTPSPIWRLRAAHRKRSPRQRARSGHGLNSPNSGPASAWVKYSMATSETPHSAPAVAPRSSPSARGRTCRCADIRMSAATMMKIPPSTAIYAASDERWGSPPPRRYPDDRQPRRRHGHADPLPPSEVKTEETLGEHREEDQAACEDGLHDRQGRERVRPDVQTKAEDGNEPAHQEPFRRRRSTALRSGWRTWTAGAATAPRCLKRKATLVAAAEPSARTSPRITRGRSIHPYASPANSAWPCSERPDGQALGEAEMVLRVTVAKFESQRLRRWRPGLGGWTLGLVLSTAAGSNPSGEHQQAGRVPSYY